MKNRIQSTPGMVTKRIDLSDWETTIINSSKIISKTSTYPDLADMVFEITNDYWEKDTNFYYEDKDDMNKNVLCTFVGRGSNELAITSRGRRFESLTMTAYPFAAFIEFLLDVVGTPTLGELGAFNYTGNHKLLGEEYVKYYQYLI